MDAVEQHQNLSRNAKAAPDTVAERTVEKKKQEYQARHRPLHSVIMSLLRRTIKIQLVRKDEKALARRTLR